MSYKTTLLSETKQIISDIKSEIMDIAKRNEIILNFNNLNKFDLLHVENNLQEIQQKEMLLKEYTNNLQEILKIDN